MNTHQRRSAVTLVASLSLLLFLLLAGSIRLYAAAASDCIGKPYGSPGCPTRPTTPQSTPSSGAGGMCGNAILDEGEECDQGRFNGKAECSTSCKLLYCGDGAVTGPIGEECEPQTEEYYILDKAGNLTTEVRFTGNDKCGWFCKPPVCEENGSCTGGCKWKFIGECPLSSSSAASVADAQATSSAAATPSSGAASSRAAVSVSSASAAVCGNGKVEEQEQCDDGNKNSLDECGNDCRKPVCGDGLAQGAEECDDKNAVDGDGCTSVCTRERCGDGKTQRGIAEECDDGNADNADECTDLCKLPRCGDGIKQEREQCDDGTKNSDAPQSACHANCMLPRCGDGITDMGEQCDAGEKNSNTIPNGCRTSCKMASCGDRVIDESEDCDDGNFVDSDQCSNTCKRPICGDNIVQAMEECDWGQKNSDTARNTCRMNCHLPRCGDNVLDDGERCDGGDSCNADCTIKGAVSSAPSSLLPAAPAEPGGAGGVLIGIGASGGAILLAILGYLLYVKLHSTARPKSASKSIDDIPLDQIEMPWHKW